MISFRKDKKKSIVVLALLVVILFLGVIWQGDFLNKNKIEEFRSGGVAVVEIDMRVLKDQWRFEPAVIEVPLNSHVRIKIYNEDSYAHSFAIAEIGKDGVNEFLLPNKTTVVEFIADKKGEFEFLCLVLCGKGHFEQKGRLIVN